MSIILILIISFIALLWAANHLVTGASGLAHHYQISNFTLGLTVVSLGTSFPEIIIAILSAFKDKTNLSLGNAVGSNIANIGLVLGIIMFVKPSFLQQNALKKTYPILILAMLFTYSSILDGFLGRIDGCLFLIGCISLISFFIYLGHHTPQPNYFSKELQPVFKTKRSIKLDLFSMLLGLLVLPISTKYVVTSAVDLARWSGMSELTIGLTVIAIGTTLPELITALTAALKNEENLALGTILGSNIYNLLLLLAFPALINPSQVSNVILYRDMPVLISLSVFLVFLNFYYKDKLSRCHGAVLFLIYMSYVISLGIKAG